MNTSKKLPSCIYATRIGYYQESEYDEYGQVAPVTWICACGHRLKTMVLDHETMDYTTVPQQKRDQFLADHSSCVSEEVLSDRWLDNSHHG